jgi:hypothetical protein
MTPAEHVTVFLLKLMAEAAYKSWRAGWGVRAFNLYADCAEAAHRIECSS